MVIENGRMPEDFQVLPEPRILANRRKHRQGFVDPAKGLPRTHIFAPGTSPITVNDSFPVATRSSPITFATVVKRTASSARGIIVEMGNATTGMAIWIPDGGTDISACAGDVGDDGVTVTAADVLQADDQLAHVVFALIPGTGEARIWVDGRMMDAAAAVNGELPNTWAASESGGFGEVATACSDRVPAGDKITLVNAAIVDNISAYAGQRPRQFTSSLYPIEP